MSSTDNKIDTNQNVDIPSSTNEFTNKSTDESVNKTIGDTIKKSIDDSTPDSIDIQLKDVNVDVKLSDITSGLFTTSNMFMLLWFLAIYIVMYYVLGMFFNKGSEPGEFQKNLGRTLDFIFFISVLVFCISYYTSKTTEQIKQDMIFLYTESLSFLEKSTSLISTSLFIISLYIIVYLFRIPMSSYSKPLFVSFIENGAWVALVLNAIVVFMQKIFNINVLDYLREFVSNEEEKPEDDSKLPSVPIEQDEVFNIADNKYTYEDAQAVCSSFGAKLATYDQIEKAYNDGAEWCNYGWSAEQMAFFPTQKETWDNLQKFPKNKNNCGRPGVNGGYIDNPYIKFGVNCYGKKPKPNENDLLRLENKQMQPIPLTAEDKELQKKIDYWKENADKLQLNSFNNTNWSRY
jgi:hypothetical protein